MAHLVVLQGGICFNDIAPYFAVIAEDAKTPNTIQSIYRGTRDNAQALLNGFNPPKHTQAQLYDATPAERAAWGVLGQPNPPGHSTHELFSDAVAYPGVPNGHALDWWQQGIDVLVQDADHWIAVARYHGWQMHRPYPAGVEYHHLNFSAVPEPGRKDTPLWKRIMTYRHNLPTHR
jgi:hypothetical protein